MIITYLAEFDINDEYIGEHEFEVDVDYERGYPAKLTGHPDNQYPAEPHVIEYNSFTHKPSNVEFSPDEFEFLMKWLGVFQSFSLDELDDQVILAWDYYNEPDYDDEEAMQEVDYM